MNPTKNRSTLVDTLTTAEYVDPSALEDALHEIRCGEGAAVVTVA